MMLVEKPLDVIAEHDRQIFRYSEISYKNHYDAYYMRNLYSFFKFMKVADFLDFIRFISKVVLKAFSHQQT